MGFGASYRCSIEKAACFITSAGEAPRLETFNYPREFSLTGTTASLWSILSIAAFRCSTTLDRSRARGADCEKALDHRLSHPVGIGSAECPGTGRRYPGDARPVSYGTFAGEGAVFGGVPVLPCASLRPGRFDAIVGADAFVTDVQPVHQYHGPKYCYAANRGRSHQLVPELPRWDHCARADGSLRQRGRDGIHEHRGCVRNRAEEFASDQLENSAGGLIRPGFQSGHDRHNCRPAEEGSADQRFRRVHQLPRTP